jgi:hypothetical protein
MRSAETVWGVRRARGRRLPWEAIYRHLDTPALSLGAYGRLARQDGVVPPGVPAAPVAALSLAKLERLVPAWRDERERWTPVRRTCLPTKSGQGRP